jgi:autophagy-related protein 17
MSDSPEQPHFVSLVVQSKKALQQGESLCTRANEMCRASSQLVVDTLALDAKVKWMTDGVLEQLRLAGDVAKTITQKRAVLQSDVKEWDLQRTQRTRSLDAILDTLGSQTVPQYLHLMPSSSSLFGSQHSSREDIRTNGNVERTIPGPDGSTDNSSKSKSLRDFVDERGIEEIIERIEEDQTILEDLLATTSSYPNTLNKHISNIKVSLSAAPQLNLESLLHEQESVTTEMAAHLESIAKHYGQMSSALREQESGEILNDEDIQVLTRDTEELPSVLTDIEESVSTIISINNQLSAQRQTVQESFDKMRAVLTSLEELGDIMGNMLDDQRQVEIDASSMHETLRSHLNSLFDLEETYLSYNLAYSRLLVELDRRSKQRDAIQAMVQGMIAQLDAIREEEIALREQFFAEQGDFLPDDLCPFVADLPAKWTVESIGDETCPAIEPSLLVRAQRDIDRAMAPPRSA